MDDGPRDRAWDLDVSGRAPLVGREPPDEVALDTGPGLSRGLDGMFLGGNEGQEKTKCQWPALTGAREPQPPHTRTSSQ
eukprot:1423509-Rhodomonas_salina.2